MPKTCSDTSIPRLRYFWLCLSLVVGVGAAHLFDINREAISAADLRTFAGIMVTAAASMSALAIASSGILYALLSVSMIKALHDAGALNRVVFDLLICAALWLVALGASLVAAMPFFIHTSIAIYIACVCAISGLLYFIPIGHAFWLLLTNAKTPIKQAPAHDWSSKTVLTPMEPNNYSTK